MSELVATPHDGLAAPPVVEFKGVSKVFMPSGHLAIQNVNFRVDDHPGVGEFISILGPSGCGKSTILRLIAGLSPHHPATTGTVRVFGKPVEGPGADRGMVFQDYTSFDHRNVQDNVAFGLECQGMKRAERIELAHEWIAKVGLSVAKDSLKYPSELSGGMRQRVAIARTLALRPRIILMDEPFGALDPSTRLNMQDLLTALWHELEATIFFITHSVEEAVLLSDRIYVMSPGPGTILQEVKVPKVHLPVRQMAKIPEIQAMIRDIREVVDDLESEVARRDQG